MRGPAESSFQRIVSTLMLVVFWASFTALGAGLVLWLAAPASDAGSLAMASGLLGLLLMPMLRVVWALATALATRDWLMLAATVALLFAAIGRIHALDPVPWLAVLIWLSPMLIGMGHDWRVRGRPHAAYVISAVWLFVGATRILLTESELWLPVGRAILGTFT